MCRDTLAGLPGLSFLPVPPSRYPGQSKYAGTFSPGAQHAGTAFGGTRYSKMCRYFFAENATSRDRLRRYPVQQNVPLLFRRECNIMPEIDANEVNQLLIASLTGRTSEGGGCTRTRHRHLGRRGPCTTLSTGVPIRSAHCSAGPHTLGGVGRWLVLVCTAAVQPIKNGSDEKEPAPNKRKKKNMDLTAPKKKNFCRMKKKHSKSKKKLFGRKRTPHIDIIVTYHLPDHSASQ